MNLLVQDYIQIIIMLIALLTAIVTIAAAWGKLSQKLKDIDERVDSAITEFKAHLSNSDFITPEACDRIRENCPEVIKMEHLEKSVEILCRTIASQNKEHLEFVERLARHMGAVEQFMKDTNETFKFLRDKKVVSFIEKMNGAHKQ